MLASPRAAQQHHRAHRASASARGTEYRATLTRIVDGDTYDLQLDLGLRVHTVARVRLCGVDTPETYGVKVFVEAWFERHGPLFIVRTFRDRAWKFGRWLVEIEDLGREERLTEQL